MAKFADTTGELQELLSKAIRNDKDALGKLLEFHRGFLRVIAQRELGRGLNVRMDASDLVQQTCLSAYRGFPNFQGREVGEFIAWLQVILKRNIGDAIREHVKAIKRSTDKEKPLDERWAKEIAVCREPSPSARMLMSERAVMLALAMEQLTADQREAVRLRHLEGRPLAEIADRLGRSEDAIAGLLKRGLRALRKQIKDDEVSVR